MDPLDRYLADLPLEEPPADLAERIRGRFHRRYKKDRRFRMSLSLALIILGGGLAVPQVFSLDGLVNLPDHGLAMVSTTLGMLVDPVEFWNGVLGSLNTLQSGLFNSLQLTFWLGLVGLVMGSFLGISGLIPAGKKD